MDRRTFMAASGGTLAAPALASAADTKPMIIELVQYRFRNTQDGMVPRAMEFFGKQYVPALGRAGVTPVGAFNSVVGPDSPFLLLVRQYADWNQYESSKQKVLADTEYQKARQAFYGSGGPAQYVRQEVTLLKGFTTMPAIEVPKPLEGNRSRIFEVRIYESNNPVTLARKVKMFDEGEIALFRKTDIMPVFFGHAIAGRNMPNLTYMVAFDDTAARDKAWGAFGSSPEWQKMRSQPGLSDGEIVSNISNYLVRPTAFSAIR